MRERSRRFSRIARPSDWGVRRLAPLGKKLYWITTMTIASPICELLRTQTKFPVVLARPDEKVARSSLAQTC